MDHRRIGARHPVGEGHEARAALLGQLHQPDDLGEQRALADRPRPAPAAAAPRLIVPANTRSPGATRCGRVSPVIRLVSSSPAPSAHGAVGADPLAGRDQDLLPGLELLGPHAAGRAVGQDEADGRGAERQQALGAPSARCRARAGRDSGRSAGRTAA